MRPDIEHHRRTRRLLWVMLFAAAAASMAGNITAAGEHGDVAITTGAIAAAAIPPLALLSLTHLAGMWSRIRTRGIVYWCFLAMVAAIAAAAFRLSFDALRSLAVSFGYGTADAALFPLIIDGLVAVCTLGLVVLARIEADDAHRDAGDSQGSSDPHREGLAAVEVVHGEAGTHRDSGGVHRGAHREASGSGNGSVRGSGDTHRESAGHGEETAAFRAIGSGGADVRADSRRELPESALNSSDSLAVTHQTQWRTTAAHRDSEAVPRIARRDSDAHRWIAHHLVDAGRTTLEPDVVHEVLDRTASGESGRAVAAQLGLSASAVQRVIKAARDAEATSART